MRDREKRTVGWCLPELIRLTAIRLTCGSDPIDKEKLLFLSLDIARRQGALSWELRSSIDLAKLLYAKGRPHEALEILQQAYCRFTEGFGTHDLIAARDLLAQISGDLG